MQIPHSETAEVAVIGTLLVCGDRFIEVVDRLTPDEFYIQDHRRIYAAMLALFRKQKPIDLVLLFDEDPEFDVAYASKLLNGAIKSDNLDYYCDILLRLSHLRRQLYTAHDIVEYFERGGDEPEYAQEQLSRLFTSSVAQGSSGAMTDVVSGLLDRVSARERGETTGNLTSTGKARLDEYFQYEPGKLYIIAGRPGMGKTAFVLDQAVSLSQQMPVLFFEQEMPAEEIGMRLASNVARVPFSKVRDASPEKPLEKAEWTRLASAYGTVKSKMDFDICDIPNRSIDDVRSEIVRNNASRVAAGRAPLKCVIFDYIQIANLGENRVQAIGDFTKTLKNLAREYNLIVIALSQLSRPPKQSYDKSGVPHIPRLDDLRDSGCIEQDADVVAFLHRPEYYLKTSGKPVGSLEGVVQVPIPKNRGGAIGMTTLGWVGELMAFSDPWWSEEETNGRSSESGGSGREPAQSRWA